MSKVQKAWTTVCSLPMRDWNGIRRTGRGGDAQVCSLPMRDWNGEYKVVYPHLSVTSVAYLWGIEMIQNLGPRLLSSRVCSLPMRDWNVVWWMTRIYLGKSVAYLWGIEIHLPDHVLRALDGSVAYLWGIEIMLSWLLNMKTSIKVCSLPMRDWN